MILIRQLTLRGSAGAVCFSEQKDKGRIQTVGFKKNAINDFSKIAYEPKDQLQYVGEKCLIYKNRRTLFEKVFRSTFYTAPLTAIAYTIYTNPFAAVFPAAIPILCVVELVLIKLWMNRIKWNENLMGQIYLLSNGEATQIYYDNQMKRRLFGEPESKIFYNSIFINPDFKKEEEEVFIMNQKDKEFPTSLERAGDSMSGYSWVKYYSNGENFIILPKRAQYINLEVLIEVFQGKIIKNKLV